MYSSQPSVRDASLYLVRDFFDTFYSLFGYNSKSPFYREAKLLQLRIGDVLTRAYRANNVPGFSTNNFRELWRLIDREADAIYVARRDFPSSIPKLSSITRLLEDIHINLHAKSGFSIAEVDRIMQDVDSAAQIYIEIIQTFLISQDLLQNMPNLPSRRLLEEMVHNPFSNALEKIQLVGDLSKLLFGNSKTIQDFVISKSLDLTSLVAIQFNVEQWTIKDFDNDRLKIKISDSELQDLKLVLDTIIDRWIFNNPYKQYIDEAPLRFGTTHSKEYLRREFDVAYKTFRAFAEHEKNSKISFNAIKIIAKAQALDKYLLSGSENNIGIKTAKAYLKCLEDFKKDAKNAIEWGIYEDAARTIKEYVKDRHLGFEDRIAIGSNQYNPIWDQHWYKSTLIIVNLLRYGARIPFTFEYLTPELFDANLATGLYQPHHIDAALKETLQFIEITLLDSVWHGRVGPLSRRTLGIELQKKLRDGMIELMNRPGSITELDIRTVFGELTFFGEKIADTWINNPDFKKLLSDWNEDRQLIQQGKFQEFFINRFTYQEGPLEKNPILDRFCVTAAQAISSFLLVMDDYDFSYLFTDADIELLKRYFKI